MNLHDQLRTINKDTIVQKNETIVVDSVPDDIVRAHRELQNLSSEVARLCSRHARLKQTLSAKSILFWDQVRDINERAETCDLRGVELGFRITSDGTPVIVEYKKDPNIQNISGFFGMGGM